MPAHEKFCENGVIFAINLPTPTPSAIFLIIWVVG